MPPISEVRAVQIFPRGIEARGSCCCPARATSSPEAIVANARTRFKHIEPHAPVSQSAPKTSGQEAQTVVKRVTGNVSDGVMHAAGTRRLLLSYVANTLRARALRRIPRWRWNSYKKLEQILPQFRIPGPLDASCCEWSVIDMGT